MPLVNLNTSPSSREERNNSIPRTQQALQDTYSADVTAREDEEEAQAAEYEEDDHKIKDAEDTRDDSDSTYQDPEQSQSSGQDSQDSQSSGRASEDWQYSGESSQETQYCAEDARQVQLMFPDLLDPQFSYDDLQDSQGSQSSFATDSTHPPFKPKAPRKVMDSDDEDADDTASESTPGKKNKEPGETTTPSGSITIPRVSNAGAGERPPLFLPSTCPSPEPYSPVTRHRRQEAANEEPLFLPSSQESAASDGSQELENLKGMWASVFGSSSQASLSSDSGEAEAEEHKKPKEEELEEGEIREPLGHTPSQRSPRTARADAHRPRAAASAPAVLQTLDANTIDTTGGRDTSAGGDDKASGNNKSEKGSDASGSKDTTANGVATPLARTPTQSTFGNDGARTPTARSPKTPPGKGKDNARDNGKGSGGGKPGATSPGAKPRGNKRPAEDPISPRRSSKAENKAPGPGGEERKYKMMRKV